MRILLYGGCHVGVIKEILLRFCPAVSDCTVITNYILIASGKKFPFETLGNYDAVIYSPIFNKSDYNTFDFGNKCVEAGALPICFPWLQWNGYHPHTLKYNSVDWIYKFWMERSAYYKNQIEYFNQNLPTSLFDFNVESHAAETSDHIAYQEQASACDIIVSKFIRENFKEHFLFLTPDHPSRFLYREVIRQISLKLRVEISKSFYESSEEFHSEQIIPIIPEIADGLNLSFRQDSYRCENEFGDKYFSMADVKDFIFHASAERFLSYNNFDPFPLLPDGAVPFHKGLYIVTSNLDGQRRFVSGSRVIHKQLTKGDLVEIERHGVRTVNLRNYSMQ